MLLVSGCGIKEWIEDINKPVRILDVRVDPKQPGLGDSIVINVDINNKNELSFIPKFNLDYDACFRNFYRSRTYDRISANSEKTYELDFDVSRWDNDCIGIHNITVEVLESSTDNVLDDHEIKINVID